MQTSLNEKELLFYVFSAGYLTGYYSYNLDLENVFSKWYDALKIIQGGASDER